MQNTPIRKRTHSMGLAATLKVQEHAIDLSTGTLAVMAMTIADAWKAADYATVEACVNHVLHIDSMTRMELTKAYIERRLPDPGITDRALKEMAQHIRDRHEESEIE